MAPISPLPGAISGARSQASFFGTSTIGRIGSRSIASWVGSRTRRAAKRGEVGLEREHHGERLVGPSFAQRAARRPPRVRRIAEQMIAADALDRDDLAGSQCRDRGSEGRRTRNLAHLVRVAEFEPRSAVRAGDRLGMKSPVARVGIFGRAVRAQAEACHGRIGAVVRQALDQGVARAALGAIDEGIAVAAIVRIVQVRRGSRRRRN